MHWRTGWRLVVVCWLALAIAPIAWGQHRAVRPDRTTGTSAAVIVDGSAALAFTAQVPPLDAAGKLTAGPDAFAQSQAVLDRLAAALARVGSGLDRVVKINVYGTRTEALGAFRSALTERLGDRPGPAISVVVCALSHPGALVAADAVATVPEGAAVPPGGDVALLPPGPRVFVSGQAVQGTDLADSTRRTLEELDQTLAFLELDRSRIVQLKAFLRPMAAVGEVQRALREHFGSSAKVPPSVFVEWTSERPPIEIELVVDARGSKRASAEPLEFLTPPALKASPVFSRVARVQEGVDLVLVSGLFGKPTDRTGAEEVSSIFEQLGAVLEETGSDARHLVKATYYVSNDEASRALNELRPRYYDPARPPTASKAPVANVGAAGQGATLDMIAIPTAASK